MGRAILLTIATAVVLVAGTTVAVAGGGGHGQCAAFGVGNELGMRDSCFDATAQFVESGSELRVTNEGVVSHTITAVDGSFDSGDIAPGETFEFRPDEPGIIQFYCRPHGDADGFGMAGVLIVDEPAPQADGAESVQVLAASESGAAREIVPVLIGLLIGSGLTAAAIRRRSAGTIADADDAGASS